MRDRRIERCVLDFNRADTYVQMTAMIDPK